MIENGIDDEEIEFVDLGKKYEKLLTDNYKQNDK